MTQNLAQTILGLMNESADPAHIAQVRELEHEVETLRQAAISASFMGAARSKAAIEKWNEAEERLNAARKMTFGEAFGPTPNHPILPAVQALAKHLNDIWGQAQDAQIAKLVAKRPYDWMHGLSDEECESQLAKHNRYVVVIPKQKYINIDTASAQNPRGGSGVFMVGGATGTIYGIKAYGVPNPARLFGTVEKPDFGGLCMKLAVAEGPEMHQLLSKRGMY